MSSNPITSSVSGKANLSLNRNDIRRSGSRFTGKRKRYQHNNSKSSTDSSTEDEGSLKMMEEIEKVFEKTIDSKFSRIEKRIIQMEERTEKMYRLMTNKDYSDKASCSEESMYRGITELIETNAEDNKKMSKSLETVNRNQNELVENTQDLISKTNRLQRTVKGLQKNYLVPGNTEKIHSDLFDPAYSDESATESSKKDVNESNKQMKRLNSSIEDLQEQMDSWFKYSNENTNRVVEKLTSMAQAVEASTLQGNVIKETINTRLIPLMNDTHKAQKGTLVEGKYFRETLEKIYESVKMKKEVNELNMSHDQNLENLSNIMESLDTLTRETSSIQTGINDIINQKLTEDFIQGTCQMMIDNKLIVENLVDKKSLSNINNTINDVKLNDVKVHLQLKELKSICLSLCSEVTLKEMTENIKENQVKHVELAADIKKFEAERLDEIKNTLQKMQKAQTKSVGKTALNPKKKSDESSDSVHSMLLQMEIKKASAEQTKLISKIDSKLQEMSDGQVNHHDLMSSFRTMVDNGLISLTTKVESRKDEVDNLSLVEERLKSCFLENFQNIMGKSKEYNDIQREILNSIEDIKLLTSSIPNTVNDLVPIVEKAVADIESFPDEVMSCLAGLEENLCANLQGRIHQMTSDNLKDIRSIFETIEQRLAVIRKYVKYGGSQSDQGNGDGKRDETKGSDVSQYVETLTGLLEKVDAVYNDVTKTHVSTESVQKELNRLANLIPSISDIKSVFSDELNLPLTTIRDVQHQILEQQAKADVVEDQFLALADEIMPRMKELKAIEDNLVSFCQNSLEPIASHLAKSNIGPRDEYKTMDINKYKSATDFDTQNVSENTSNVNRNIQPSIRKSNDSRSTAKDTKTFNERNLIADQRQKHAKLDIMSYPNISKSKNTNSRGRKGANTSSRLIKRSPSTSSEDSIIDTNSEAPDPGDIMQRI